MTEFQAILEQLNLQNQINIKGIIETMQAQNAGLFKQIATELAGPKSHGGMVDSRGIGKPGTFKGDELKYIEWMAKLDSYIRVSNSAAAEWLNVICITSSPSRSWLMGTRSCSTRSRSSVLNSRQF